MIAVLVLFGMITTNVDNFTDKAQVCADSKSQSEICQGYFVKKEISYRVENEKK